MASIAICRAFVQAPAPPVFSGDRWTKTIPYDERTRLHGSELVSIVTEALCLSAIPALLTAILAQEQLSRL
ncbi:MAG TPA: hypothetical protein EYH50_04315 [Pyrodictium delaneyi]|uniref:Uncharacterized protein n=1 Tax=Pyrodictium delaneyi TaxID=1273541 RepID=A0A832ZWX8_9CREN|nr:hypothetical protein [Pyrodictium delaneyi]